jgi:hypothetical protein
VPARYANVAVDSGALEELKASVVDYKMVESPEPQLAFLFVVDMVAVQPDYVEVVKQCLIAALEGAPSGSLMGLVLVAETVSVFDLGSRNAVSVKHLADPTLGIEQVLPLSRFMVSTADDANLDALLQAIDSLHRFVAPSETPRNVAAATAAVISYAGMNVVAVTVLFFLSFRLVVTRAKLFGITFLTARFNRMLQRSAPAARGPFPERSALRSEQPSCHGH